MKIRIYANKDIADKYKIISINDPEDDYLFEEAHPNILSLKFHDISYVEDHELLASILGKGYKLFSENDAIKVIEFLEKCELTDNLIIHCFAGVSRSAAIGTFAREMFNVDYSTFKHMNPQICPNVYVLRVLTDMYQEMYNEPHIDFLKV